MKSDKRFAVGLTLVLLLVSAWALLAAAAVWATLEPVARSTVAAALSDRIALALLVWAFQAGLCAWLFHRFYASHVVAPGQLAEAAATLLASSTERPLVAAGSAETRALAALIDSLAQQRGALRDDVDRRVREASREVEQERNRLAALMSELTESVVVCNLDGRILLYNGRARLLFRSLSRAPALADGAELIGIGRSIYGVFDTQLVAHALEAIEQRMQRGAATPTAQFVTTTAGGQLLRAQMAPVRATGDDAAGARLSGFVLMLADITSDFETDSARDRLLNALAEGGRASLANLQAAIDMLDYPDLDPAMRERFQGVVRDEVRAMSGRVQALANEAARDMKTRWPLEDMLGADLVGAAARRIASVAGIRAHGDDTDAALWLKVDSFSLLQALCYLAARLAEEFEVKLVQLRLQAADANRVHLDLVWAGRVMSTETVISWETDPMRIGGENLPLTVRDVVERHGGAFWFGRERVRHQAFFRFLLPLAHGAAAAEGAALAQGDARPEYYDFDLFRTSAQSRTLDDRLLTELAYTVFDTETTGLDPAAGDEILQIGATRIVNGRLLRHESFDRLVDPQRPIPAASIPIHGIGPDMVAGQPTLVEVLPAFHRYAADTVLVAHNAAFDMRFLQLKEAATGVRFDQPVLDTLLLSAVIHPNQDSHALEAIAGRFGVTVVGRHTALGDAIVTAEVFLRMVPLLADKGIRTLGEAREAARQTYYARLTY